MTVITACHHNCQEFLVMSWKKRILRKDNYLISWAPFSYIIWYVKSVELLKIKKSVLLSLRLQWAMKQYSLMNWKEGCKVTSLGLLRPTPPQPHYSLEVLGVAFFLCQLWALLDSQKYQEDCKCKRWSFPSACTSVSTTLVATGSFFAPLSLRWEEWPCPTKQKAFNI